MANYVMGFVTGAVFGSVGVLLAVAIYGSRSSRETKHASTATWRRN